MYARDSGQIATLIGVVQVWVEMLRLRAGVGEAALGY